MVDQKNIINKPTAGGSNLASSSKGKEVIKSNHSKQITALKNELENFQLSEITEQKIKSKIAKQVKKIDTEITLTSHKFRNEHRHWIFGTTRGAEEIIWEVTNEEWKRQGGLVMEITVAQLINVAANDLLEQKNKLVIELADLSEKVSDRENGLLGTINKLEREIMKKNEILEKGRKAVEEARKRAEAEIREGKTVDSKSIVDLKIAVEKIDELQIEIIQLRKNRNDLLFVIDGKDIEVKEKEGEVELKQQELDNAINAAEVLNQRVEEARKERNEAQKELNTLKNVKIPNLKIDINEEKRRVEEKEAEIKDLKEQLKQHEPSMLYKVADKLGIIQLKNSISNAFMVAGAVVVLYAISWMWKYLVKPTFRNFKRDKNEDEDEQPSPRKRERVRYEDYEEISEPKKTPQPLPEKQPTIIINSNPSPVISKEQIKPEETSTQISNEKTDPKISEPQENKKSPKKRKNSQKKTKKKVKGDSD